MHIILQLFYVINRQPGKFNYFLQRITTLSQHKFSNSKFFFGFTFSFTLGKRFFANVLHTHFVSHIGIPHFLIILDFRNRIGDIAREITGNCITVDVVKQGLSG